MMLDRSGWAPRPVRMGSGKVKIPWPQQGLNTGLSNLQPVTILSTLYQIHLPFYTHTVFELYLMSRTGTGTVNCQVLQHLYSYVGSSELPHHEYNSISHTT
jgi:hypothetical protein